MVTVIEVRIQATEVIAAGKMSIAKTGETNIKNDLC